MGSRHVHFLLYLCLLSSFSTFVFFGTSFVPLIAGVGAISVIAHFFDVIDTLKSKEM